MKKLFIIFTLISSFLLIATPVFAQLGPTPLEDTRCVIDPSGDQIATLDCIPVIIGNVVFWLLVFAGIVALVLIIISGFKFINSAGEPKKAEGARKTLTYAVLGLILILLSFGIVGFIAQATDVGCITKFGFTQCVPECDRIDDCPDGYVCSGGGCIRDNR